MADEEKKADAPATGAKPVRRGARKERKSIPLGRVTVHASFNNTIITFADPQGNVIAWSSAGASGFKGSRKSTPYAAQLAAQNAARKAADVGMREVDVLISGPGPGRDSAIRALQQAGIRVRSISDATPIPHNGCRPPKKRRV